MKYDRVGETSMSASAAAAAKVVDLAQALLDSSEPTSSQEESDAIRVALDRAQKENRNFLNLSKDASKELETSSVSRK